MRNSSLGSEVVRVLGEEGARACDSRVFTGRSGHKNDSLLVLDSITHRHYNNINSSTMEQNSAPEMESR